MVSVLLGVANTPDKSIISKTHNQGMGLSSLCDLMRCHNGISFFHKQ